MVDGPGRPPVEHTTEEKAQALALLAANEGNLAKTSEELKLTPYHLRKIRNNNLELYRRIQKQIAADLYDKTTIMAGTYADEILRRIEDPEELEKMNTKHLATVFGIAIDKIDVMTRVQSKFENVQRKSQDYESYSDEQLVDILEGKFKVIEEEKQHEDMPDTPKDGVPARPSGVSAIGSALHRSHSKEP